MTTAIKHLPNQFPSRPIPAKVESMTLQLRGMLRVLRDNEREILAIDRKALCDMTIAAMQLAHKLKLMVD